MQLMIETLRATSIAQRRMELVERMYLERAGAILHYNVDKSLLDAGQCEKEFGRGTLQRPIELIIGDRATDGERTVSAVPRNPRRGTTC